MLHFIKHSFYLLQNHFNLGLLLSVVIYLLSSFLYIKNKNTKKFIIRMLISGSVLLIILISGFFLGYELIFDNQDVMYIIFIILYLMTFICGVSQKYVLFSKIIIFSILSILFIHTIDKIELIYIDTVLILILFFLLLACDFNKNRKLLLTSLGGLIIFSCVFSISHIGKINFYYWNVSRIVFLVFNACVIIIFCLAIFIKEVKETSILSENELLTKIEENLNNIHSNEKQLFETRKKDFCRLFKLLSDPNKNCIGIISKWGNGKTYLVNILKNYFKDYYNLISISLLSLRIENIENVILNEINALLEENRIYSRTSTKIKSILNQSVFHDLVQFFISEKSYSSLIEILKNEINKLDKPLIISFEDIDRIYDKECIQKMFSISEELSSSRIKILFQYDEEKLLDLLEIDHIFLEKYIPFSMVLSEIPFSEIIYTIIKQDYPSQSYMTLKDFSFLFQRIHLPAKHLTSIQNYKYLCLPQYGYQIRSVEIFIKDAYSAICSLNKSEIINYKQIIICLCYIKIFDSDLFRKFDFSFSLFYQLPIIYNNIQYNLCDFALLYNSNKISIEKLYETLNQDRNSKNFLYCIFFSWRLKVFFQYDFYQSDIGASEWFNQLFNKTFDTIKDDEVNTKIDTLICSVIYAGENEMTPFEESVNYMNNEVLNINLPEEIRYEKYIELRNSLPRGLGITPLVHAYYIYEKSIVNWQAFIKLIFNYEFNNRNIDYYVIQNMNYFNINNNQLFIDALKQFNYMKTKYNLSNCDYYKQFLNIYLEKLVKLGYIKESEKIIPPKYNKGFKKKELKTYFQYYIQLIDSKITQITIQQIIDELEIIKSFFNKNIELCDKRKESTKAGKVIMQDGEQKKKLIKKYLRNSNTNIDNELYDDFCDAKLSIDDIISINTKRK